MEMMYVGVWSRERACVVREVGRLNRRMIRFGSRVA